MSTGLEAEPVVLGQRLQEEVQLFCPLFQRTYVWGKKEINQLWEDMSTVLDGQYDSRFLGAIVLDAEEGPGVTKAGKYWIIDGQQRMTTLSLIMLALIKTALELDELGREYAEDLANQYVLSQKARTRHQQKLYPTITDRKQFRSVIIDALGPIQSDLGHAIDAGDPKGKVTDAYEHLCKLVRRHCWTDESGGRLAPEARLARLEELRDTFLESIEIVEIVIGDAHDPNEVFDRLNKEGVRLGIIDLVRNEVLKRLGGNAKEALHMYTEQWAPFEDSFHDSKLAADYFFPYALTIDSSLTKAKTFARLSQHWAALSEGMDNEVDQLSVIMKDLRHHVTAYNAIAAGVVGHLSPGLGASVSRLVNSRRPSSVYPYAMELITAAMGGDVSETDAIECLSIVESFLVRRALVGIEPTGLHAVFKKLWDAAGADPRMVRRGLVTATVVFPEDERLRKAIEKDNLYDRKVAQYVLLEYEREFTDGDVLEVFPAMTIDHILPRKWTAAKWPQFTEPEHAALVNTWANLVPLSNPANAQKGNKSWADARGILDTETVFSTTAQVYKKFSDWNPDAIASRSEELQTWATLRWPNYNEYLD